MYIYTYIYLMLGESFIDYTKQDSPAEEFLTSLSYQEALKQEGDTVLGDGMLFHFCIH